MARPPVIKSVPLAIIANGRAVAGFIRESQTLLRRNIELLKHLEPEGPEDKAAIAEYLEDPVVNPLLEKRSEEPAEVKALSEKDKGIAKVVRHLQDSGEEEVEMLLRFLRATKKTPSPKGGPRESLKVGAPAAPEPTGAAPTSGKVAVR